MANEILIVTIDDYGDVGETYNCLFLYPVASPLDIAGTPVALTPSSTVPPEVTQYNLLTAGELDSLDSGTSAFLLVQVDNFDGLTDNEVLQKARDLYDNQKLTEGALLRRKYEKMGTRFNA